MVAMLEHLHLLSFTALCCAKSAVTCCAACYALSCLHGGLVHEVTAARCVLHEQPDIRQKWLWTAALSQSIAGFFQNKRFTVCDVFGF